MLLVHPGNGPSVKQEDRRVVRVVANPRDWLTSSIIKSDVVHVFYSRSFIFIRLRPVWGGQGAGIFRGQGWGMLGIPNHTSLPVRRDAHAK